MGYPSRGLIRKMGGRADPYEAMLPEEPDTGRNRRWEDRYSCDAAIRWAYFASGRYVSGRIVNASRSGCCIETPHPLKAGSSVTIHLLISGRAEESAKRCRWVRTMALAQIKWARRVKGGGAPHYTAGSQYYLYY